MTPDEFKQARRDLGLKQGQMATVMGWTQGHVSRIENGHEPISRLAVLALQALLMGYRPADWPAE